MAHAGDADHSVLGEGYAATIAGTTPRPVRDFSLGTGSVANSWQPFDHVRGYAYIPGGSYKYVGHNGYVYRYTVGGSLVSSFSGDGELAATDKYSALAGEYILTVKGRRTTVYTSDGSRVASFGITPSNILYNNGAVCGPGYPEYYGNTLWCLFVCDNQYSSDAYAYQIYLGNGVAVEPTSLGKIKALYR